ncbi:AAA family ATPase [Kineococcus endophyticus]|uniref:AAA family ATPase n=1 Tax=Kineococcus endophyticus TaxID=1181883 RepID=A0ABV3PDZ6_9ACTN
MTDTDQRLASNSQETSKLRITLANLKGGVGRSTSSVYLALTLARLRPTERVLLVDADASNPTSWDWSEDAAEDWPAQIVVNRWPSVHLAKRIKEVSGDYDHVIVDTGPHDAGIVRAALQVTDHLLLPLAPSMSEVKRVTPTLDVAAEVAVLRPIQLSLLFNRVVPNTRSRIEAREALEGMGLHVLAAEVGRREAYSGAHGSVPTDLGTYPDVLEELLRRPPADADDDTADSTGIDDTATEGER